MHILTKYNSLKGQNVFRGEIRKMINEAKKENISEIVDKLTTLLKEFPDKKQFSLNVVNKIERALKSELNGLEELENQDNENGLDGVKPDEIYQFITDMILEIIKEDGSIRWDKPWLANNSGDLARNFDSGKLYRGINAFLLNVAYPLFNKKENGSPYFLTIKQIEKNKGRLRKGSKGARVIYFTKLYHYESQEEKIDISSYNRKKFIALLLKSGAKILNSKSIESIADSSFIPILKYYNVFNASDVDDLPDSKAVKENEKIQDKIKAFKDIDLAERIIEHIPNPPKIKHGGNEAYFVARTDLVQLPIKGAFKSPQKYYATAFHELVHSTGVKKRLDRDMSGRFGSKSYAFEELVAELGSSFLTAECGILNFHIKNTAAYLKGWSSKLVSNMEEDNRFFFRAASKAQAAADYVLDRDEKGQPKYQKHLEKQKEEKKPALPKKKTTVKPKVTITKVVKPKPTPKPKVKTKPKVGDQLALFGLKPHCNHPLVMSLNGLQKAQEKTPSVLYDIDGDFKRFLGGIEIKPFHSIAITLDAEQGAGKTRFVFQSMNHFAEKGYKSLFVSLEEHPQSQLFLDKIDMYISEPGKRNIDTIAELPNWYQTLAELIPYYDCIFIDSWNKIAEEDRKVDFDRDLRKKFDGKMFFTIFQQTTNGGMRGGAKAGFDGDVILRVQKDLDFKKSYVYANKNRYQDIPLDQLRFSIYHKRLLTKKEIDLMDNPEKVGSKEPLKT